MTTLLTFQPLIPSQPLRRFVVTVFLIALTLFLTQGTAHAQGFVEGGPDISIDDVLNGAGSLDDAVGGLFTLFDDFSFENFANFACSSATAANEIDGSADSATAQEIACAIAGLPEEIETLLNNYETLIETQGNDFFSSVLSFALGSENYLTASQISEFTATIDNALENYTDPETFLSSVNEVIEESSNLENANYANAPEGSSEAGFWDAVQLNPAVATSYGLGQIEEAATKRRDALSVMGVKETGEAADISKMTSDYQDEIRDTVNEDVAPALREAAATAVSTRAVTQTLVDAISVYMQQEAISDANLSKQLMAQSQQQVYTNNGLHLLLQTMSKERLEEQQAEQSNLKAMLQQHEQVVTRSVDTNTSVALSLTTLDDQLTVDTSLFDF